MQIKPYINDCTALFHLISTLLMQTKMLTKFQENLVSRSKEITLVSQINTASAVCCYEHFYSPNLKKIPLVGLKFLF